MKVGRSSASPPMVRMHPNRNRSSSRKNQRPNPMKNEQGGIVNKDMPIAVSNVAVWNPVTQKADRVGFRVLDDGRKVRFYKSNGELVNA